MTESINTGLSPADLVMGGKLRCEGCGGEWWISADEAARYAANGWPHKCGNSAGVGAKGSREDCADESECVYIPYDVDENVAKFEALAEKNLRAAEAADAAAKASDDDEDLAQAKAEREARRADAEKFLAVAKSIPEDAERLLTIAAEAEAPLSGAEIEARLAALGKED